MIGKLTDRLLRLRIKRDEKEFKVGFLIVGIVIVLLFANVFYLNLIVINSNNNTVSSQSTDKTDSENITPTVLLSESRTEVSNLQPTTQATQSQSTVKKDYYINLGSGSNRSTEWADVGGTINTFDIASYNKIYEVRLETNVNVPTSNGTVSVRLFNKTDNSSVWNSERTVQAEENGSLLISEKINYPFGPKLYSVQMKSQLGVEANLVQARLHIIAE